MSNSNLPPAAALGDNLGDAISLVFDDGSEVQMSKSFATTLDRKMDYLSENGGEGNERYSMTDEYYDQVGHAAALMNRSAVDANRDNVDLLDASAIDYMQDLASLFMTQQGRAVESGAESRGDASRIKYFADGYRGAFDAATAPPEPPAGSRGGDGDGGGDDGPSGAGAAGGDMDMSEVKEMLGEVRESDNSSAKSSKLSEAIAALIAQIRGTAGGAAGSGTSPLQQKVDDLVDTIAGTGGGASGTGTQTSGPSENEESEEGASASGGGGSAPRAAPEPRTQTLEGDALMGRLDAGGKSLTFDGSDGGIGIRGGEDDEIGPGQRLTFRPEEPATGGSVDLVDLFGTGKKGQETATITVMKDGKEVDQITVRGDMDGDQTAKIDQAFDELVFTSGGGKSDFAVKSITTETGGEEAPEASGGAAGPDEAGGAAEEAARADFDVTQLLDLLQALSDTIALIDGAQNLSDADKDALLDKVADVVDPIAQSLDEDGEGGGAVTGEEVATILEGVTGLNEEVEDEIDDSGSKNDVLDALAMGVGRVADEMA